MTDTTRGGFIDHHFSFTGDGRTNGQENNNSGLGDSKELAKKIICNAALQLSYAGWVPSNVSFADDTISDEVWIQNNSNSYTKLYVKNNDTYAVLELPMTYTENNKVTKIWLLYSYGVKNSSNVYTYATDNALNTYLNLNQTTTTDYEWGINTYQNPGSSIGLCLLYCPPDCNKINSMKIGSIISSISSYNRPLSICNATSTYTYHIITRNNFIGIFWHVSDRNISMHGYVFGPILDNMYDSTDTTCSYKEYAGLTNQLNVRMTVPEYSYGSTNNTDFIYYESSSYNPIRGIMLQRPHLQFYNTAGVPQMCNSYSAVNIRSSYLSNPGLFMTSYSLLRAINIISKKETPPPIAYSKILIGNQLGTDTTYWAYQAKVSANNGIKGTINPDFVIAVDSSEYVENCQRLFNVGQTFNKKEYIHIGNGICIGWDKSNTISIIDDSSNPMLPIYTSNPNA